MRLLLIAAFPIALGCSSAVHVELRAPLFASPVRKSAEVPAPLSSCCSPEDEDPPEHLRLDWFEIAGPGVVIVARYLETAHALAELTREDFRCDLDAAAAAGLTLHLDVVGHDDGHATVRRSPPVLYVSRDGTTTEEPTFPDALAECVGTGIARTHWPPKLGSDDLTIFFTGAP
jgi:hypothetical protein